jgi:hypothetical protein
MDWIKQNKFLATWLAVTIVVAGALGYLYIAAKGRFTEAQDTYTTKVGELQGLQNQSPFPEDENLKKMQELQKAHQATIETLQKELAKTDLPTAPLSAVKFQDELRESVKRVTALATEKGTKLPDNFYMAFPKYQTSTPPEEIAPALGRMLKAMEFAITGLLQTRVSEITDLKREELPEEGGGQSTTPTPPTAPGGKDKDKDKNALVHKNWFEVSFVGSEAGFRRFVDDLVSSKTQFYIPRNVVIENEKLVGPPKFAAAGSPNVPVPPPAPNPAAPPGLPGAAAAKSESIVYVIGMEKLKVTLRVDVVDFADAASLTSTK